MRIDEHIFQLHTHIAMYMCITYRYTQFYESVSQIYTEKTITFVKQRIGIFALSLLTQSTEDCYLFTHTLCPERWIYTRVNTPSSRPTSEFIEQRLEYIGMTLWLRNLLCNPRFQVQPHCTAPKFETNFSQAM